MYSILLLGAPGAGKGTQAGKLAEVKGIPKISTGDILRANVRDKTALGSKAREYMDRGDLVPDSLVVEMVADRIEAPDCNDGFILDGFPRNIAQAEALESTLKVLGGRTDCVIGIEVERDELVKRLSGRRVCSQCGEGYHVVTNPPVAGDKCDKCGGEIYQRDDDSESTIKARLEVYEKETLPLVGYYKDKGVYHAVKGTGTVDRISELIVGEIESGSRHT